VNAARIPGAAEAFVYNGQEQSFALSPFVLVRTCKYQPSETDAVDTTDRVCFKVSLFTHGVCFYFGICGGPGQLTQSCCGNMQCERLLGGSQMRCQQSQPSCVEENGICGGPGQLTQSCCGNMQCKRLLGGVKMRCLA